MMTSPARTLRAVGSCRFQKSFKARTFRIPDASEDKGWREERRCQSAGKKESSLGKAEGENKSEERGEENINTTGRT